MATTAFKIETSVPLPNLRTAAAKYPWRELEVGQSFVVQTSAKYFPSQVSQAGRLHSRKFSCRAVDGGWRVWRVA